MVWSSLFSEITSSHFLRHHMRKTQARRLEILHPCLPPAVRRLVHRRVITRPELNSLYPFKVNSCLVDTPLLLTLTIKDKIQIPINSLRFDGKLLLVLRTLAILETTQHLEGLCYNES